MQSPSPVATDFAFCPHDRGPGISVCLRCRAEAHRRGAVVRRKVATWAAVGLVTVSVAVVGGTNALEARAKSTAAGHEVAAVRHRAAETFSVAQAGAEETAPAAVAKPAALSADAPAPAIDSGRTELGSGRFAERSGEVVTVQFDTPVYRTRRRDKFESTVRETLPMVYGAFADSLLGAVPVGNLATSGDLLTELPQRGIALPARDGWTMTLWPVTRPGQDGPLVVSYRTTVARVR